MTSKRIEDTHVSMLQKVLSETGLSCERPTSYESTEQSEEEIAFETELEFEEESMLVEEQEKEETASATEEAVAEQVPDVFPTPSLRRMIPERLRRVEALNRIRVLPESFNTNIDPTQIPIIRYTAPKKYIDILGELTGCKRYKANMAEYWFLDTLANLLRRAQEDELSRRTQVVLILWFYEWMREIQNFDAASRERMLRRWKDNMLAAAKFACDEDHVPAPAEVGVYYKASADKNADAADATTPTTPRFGMNKQTVAQATTRALEKDNPCYDCNMQDLIKIIHYIYDLFSTDYQFNLVRSVFTFGPGYNLINGPYQIETPKKLYTPIKIKPKKEPKPKKEKKSKKIPDTPEFLALMEFKKKDFRLLDEQVEYEMEEFNKRNSILPLGFAATAELFDNYWPPPSIESVEVLPPPPPKKEKKKK